MKDQIDALFGLCKEQPFDVNTIEEYIRDNKVGTEAITRAALKLCDYGNFSYSEYLYHNGKEPLPEELKTYNWESLFDVLIKNGLDASLVICDDGINYENVLQSIQYFDDADLSARVLRNILSKGGTPNVLIDSRTFFEEFDSDFIMDIQMGLYPHKWQVDNVFRFWLVLIGFGGVIKDGELPVNMCDNNSPEIFKRFEEFDYHITRSENDFELCIFSKETGVVVAKVYPPLFVHRTSGRDQVARQFDIYVKKALHFWQPVV